MRRLKPVFLDVKNIGRDGKKTTVSIPLRVDLGKQPHKSTEENSQDTNSSVEQDVPLDDLDKQELSTQQQNRVLSISANWEKVREKLLNSYIEEQHLPDKINCVNCQKSIATTRCEYCGPRQYFCVECARALHVNRNKFHVLEQWKEFDVDEHITNISSYRLSFFEKLVLCRGLKFSIAQPVPARDVKASFEKAYWRLEPTLPEDQKELAAATLRSIALNYIQRRGPRPPKALQQAINQLRRREDIVITKPDKGSGVVVMDKTEYIRLLSDASIKDTTKFTPINTERPKTRGRPPKHYHPLLQKEKQLESVVRKILPKPIADTVCRKGSRLAHLYGLPKTHKQQLSMRPILSSTGTYNFALAKWLEEKLKPLSLNQHTISDIFSFAEVIRETPLNPNDILVSYDVCALFTNVPLDETIEIIAEKAFKNNWFNETHGLNLTKTGLTELLRIATKDQLFQFDGQLYEQVDGVAMGSPLGPLMANVFLCSIEEQLDRNNKLPSFYKRYVDDTLATMPNIQAATAFLSTLNECHPAIQFTMEIAENNKLPFLGMMIEKNGCHLTTSVYHKPTDTGLLLHYQSHVDQRYKRSLLNTMLNRAYRLSSTKESFTKECQHLKRMFTKLKYPVKLINSAIAWYTSSTIQSRHETPTELDAATQKPVRITLPFKDQKSADTVRHQLKDLGRKIGTDLQPVFTSRKIEGKLKIQEEKPALINHQCVVYTFKCDSCDADYIGYTTRHLHQRIEEHKASVIGKHLREAHVVKSIHKTLSEVNGYFPNDVPQTLYDDAKDARSSIYSEVQEEGDTVPALVRRQIIDLFCLHNRCQDELAL
ncbi:hypothetical protein AWC38_SpisGene19737 [Stylophora pistillata]|uniref:Reverse transcriptase domain-containing protein n=2 Tax=Stylophora pistillata TaxID=50429 RepID=A0A2B4RGQ4_STYPI|nr:hypothetical protein AWC38_SpisGene19737 [Stylophora pistillata]